MDLKDHFIISTELLSENECAQHVGYVFHHNGDGTSLAAWLNQSVENETIEVGMRARFSLGDQAVIGTGGTVEAGKLTFLAPTENLLEALPVYCGGDSSIFYSMNPDNLKALSGKGAKVRVLFGIAAWQDNELEDQVNSGLFKVVPASAKTLFNTPREQLWQKLINA